MLLSVTISSTQLAELAALSRQSTATTVTNIPVTSSVVSDHDKDASGVPEPVTHTQHAGLADSTQRPRVHLMFRTVKKLPLNRSRANTGTGAEMMQAGVMQE
jgi:hypothetical protein